MDAPDGAPGTADERRGDSLSVGLASPSRHWTFDLGRELHRQGVLQRLYTQYPKSCVETVPSALVRSYPWFLGATYGLARIGWTGAWERLDPLRMRTYDRWLSGVLEPCSVFHCIAGFGVRAHALAREKFGALTVCDRAAAHIRTQDRIVEEERARWGFKPNPFPPVIVERYLAEYDACDVILVPSPFAKGTFIDEGVSADKVAVVPLAADLSLFKPLPKEDDVFRVLYVGAIGVEKGIPYLLQALCGPAPECEVWLVGPPTAETEQILGRFPDGYRYFGPLPRAELSWYYSQASVLVLPSVQDGFGMVMAQAMACGVPVIATNNTGAAALFDDGEAGYHVPAGDPEAIRAAVLTLRDDPDLRRRLAQRALEKMQNLGGWREYGESVVSVYRRALASRGAGPA